VIGNDVVNVTDNGSGTVTLNGVTVPYNSATGLSSEDVTVAAGTYEVVAAAAAGWKFLEWSYGPSSTMVGFNSTTNVSFPVGVASLTAVFAANVTTFNTPAAGGRVALDDVGPLANGTSTWLPRGTYDLDALPFGNQVFLRWTVNNSAALSVASPTASITVLRVNSTGTVVAEFANSTPVNITFANNPSNGGDIRFNYQLVSGALTVNSTLSAGIYLVRAVPASGWVFKSWTITDPPLSFQVVTGNLIVAGSGGKLTANFARAVFGISFVSEQTNVFVNASIGGHIVVSGGTINLAPGKYPLAPLLGANTTFLKWVPTGGMFVGNPVLATTNLTVYGAGTLAAIADGFSFSGLRATPPGTDVGVGVTFSATFNGSAPHSFFWTGLPFGCVTRNVDPLSCVPNTGGSYRVVLTVSGANGIPVRSAPLSFIVTGPLAVASFTAAPSSLDLGMTTVLTPHLAGGTGPFTYVYGSLPAGCTSANTSQLACTPTETGTSTVQVTVTDAIGAQASATVGVSVFPALVVQALNSSLYVLTATVPFQLTSAVVGGAPSLTFNYTGLPTGCSSNNVASLSCTPPAGDVGNFTVEVNVTDGAGASGTATATIHVNALPSVVSFTPTPNTIALGSNVTFLVTTAGGTGPLNYSYAVLPSGCVNVNAPTFECTPLLVGVFEVTVTITDSFGRSTSDSATLTVTPQSSTSSGGAPTVPWWWVVVAVVVVLLLVILAYVVWGRKRPPAAPVVSSTTTTSTSSVSSPSSSPPPTAPAESWDENNGG
jgi:hypothetical protein